VVKDSVAELLIHVVGSSMAVAEEVAEDMAAVAVAE
jgi:hypothetical protein